MPQRPSLLLHRPSLNRPDSNRTPSEYHPVIQAALNGGRTRTDHPAIPITPEELAQSARESIAAGAAGVHFHVRGSDGKESVAGADVTASLEAVRAAIPQVPVGVSTGAWIVKDTTLRYQLISQWTTMPDFASVNFNENGAVELAQLLLSRGIGIEVGLADVAGTQAFLKGGLAKRCLRLLIEPMQTSLDEALRTLEGILGLLRGADVNLPILFHGLNATAWGMIDEAAARGYDTRVGFEDILTLPDGSMAKGNGELVAEAGRRMLRR
jgi:uncharacterized protein (DUF849 family)